MVDSMSRVEVEDLFRHLTTKVDRAQQQAALAVEESRCLSRALQIASFQIRQLTTWLVPLLSAEQQEVIGVERRAGVTDEPLVSDDVVEANDGDEWRARLKRRAAELQARVGMTRAQGAAMTAAEVEAFKSLGSMFVVPRGDGPCFNRDSEDLRAGDSMVSREDDFLG